MSSSSPSSTLNVGVRPGKPPILRVDATGDAPRGARVLRVASMIAFIAALLGLGNWACRGQTPTETRARPLRFAPGSGPIEGDRFVFIDVEEPAAAIGTASIACQCGQRARWDRPARGGCEGTDYGALPDRCVLRPGAASLRFGAGGL